jgi:hypothetical protein
MTGPFRRPRALSATPAGVRALAARIEELAARSAAAAQRRRGLAEREWSRRLIASPTGLDAALALAEWVFNRQGVDDTDRGPGSALSIAEAVRAGLGEPETAELLGGWIAAIERVDDDEPVAPPRGH